MAETITLQRSRFDGERFRSYFSFYFYSNRRRLLLGASQILIFSFLLTLFFFYTGGERGYQIMMNPDFGYYDSSERIDVNSTDPFWGLESGLMIALSMLFMAFSGSWMFSAMSNKKNRLSVIEIPASQFEKFLTWWIIYLPMALLAMLACFWLTDLLRVIWIKIFSPYGNFAHLMPIKNILALDPINSAKDSLGISGVIYGMVISINALFALGSILFHKLSFLKTVAACFILLVVFTILYVLGLNTFFDGSVAGLSGRLDWDETQANVILGCVGAAFSIAVYWLCYARLKEEDIINRW